MKLAVVNSHHMSVSQDTLLKQTSFIVFIVYSLEELVHHIVRFHKNVR